MNENLIITTSLPRIPSPQYLDTNSITLDYEYTILEHLYSPLVEIDNNGDIVSGVASSFRWHGSDAIFTIRNDIEIYPNQWLQPSDVAATFKRLLLSGKQTHGHLINLLCPNKQDLSDDCHPITIKDRDVIFHFEQKVPYLFRMLASIDFGIIPEAAIDFATLKIRDHSLSSGPYQLVKYDKSLIEMKIRKNHYHYNNKAPQTIKFVHLNQNSIQALKDKKIDIIVNDDNSHSTDELINFSKETDMRSHITHFIKATVLNFTKKGLSRIPIKRREIIASKIRMIMKKSLQDHAYVQFNESFYPNTGEIALDYLQQQELRIREEHGENISETGKDLTLVVAPSKHDFYTKLFKKYLPDLKIITAQAPPNRFGDDADTPEMIIQHLDTGFFENIGLVAYAVNNGFFITDKKESEAWLDQYLNTHDQKQRIALAKELHYQSLKNIVMAPLYHSPYTSITHKKLDLNFSKFYANTPLWKIRKI